jgi:hypothetical protein
MLRKISNSPTRKEKVLTAVLWNPLGVFGGGISGICTPNYCSHVLCHAKNLGQTLKKQIGIISVGVTMPDRTGHSSLGLAAQFGLETLEHAPHSPDFGSTYYHLFTA